MSSVFLELVFAFFFSKMRALSPSVYILSSNFPVFEVSSLTFLFNFVTCVLGVFDGQKRAPSVCVCSFELGVWAGAKFLGEFNARPGGKFSYHGGIYLLYTRHYNLLLI